MDSSSTESPFSNRSTIPSSPENANGSGDKSSSAVVGAAAAAGAAAQPLSGQQHAGYSQSSGHLMQGMHAILSNLTGSSSYGSFASNFGIAKQQQSQQQPQQQQPQQQQQQQQPGNNSTTDVKPALPTHVTQKPAASTSGSGHGGSRTEPPKRQYEVDGLQIATPSLDDIAAGYSTRRNKILIQGDPQTIHKQRVETAIRAVIDIVRQIPPSPSVPAPHATLAALVPRDPTGNILYSFERLANFRGLRLQAGTTTKTSSKKQLAAGQIPPHQLAYVETAVYMSGESGKRVYACKRCRAREERRRQNKDAARKKQIASDSDASSSPAPRPSIHPPTEDYITGENSAQYDPHRMGQVVEEPQWDPTVPDWRHEIVLFNSPPDVAVKDGSCFWLPFRVICYCKCHGEKVGFRIKFTLRTYDGRIIASDMTHPIKITDDHKTDAKSKPKVERFTSTSSSVAAVPRARKGRMSTASSQRHSPAPSESEVSVTSEVGAVTHKQTPQARQGKPYERPPSQSPAVPPSNLPFDFMNGAERPRLSRQVSASSYASQTDITNWLPDAAAQNTVSPDALRRPNFAQLVGMTNINSMSNNSSLAPSPHQQPPQMLQQQQQQQQPAMNGNATNHLGMNGLGASDIYANNELNMSHPKLDLASFGNGAFNTQSPSEDVDMTNVTSELENMLFGGSSHASVSSSYQDDHSSVFSGFNTGSLFSDSGLPPDNALEDMIDFSGGESNSAISPMHHLNLSPTTNMGSLDLQGMGRSPFSQPGNLAQGPAMNNHDPDAQTRALLALFAQQQAQNQRQQQQQQQQQQQVQQQQQHIPMQPAPVLSHVIPGEGDMAGGMPVAIAGRLFTPETVITFGGRPAITTFVSDSFLQCTLPASPTPGEVEVTVQGAMMDPTQPPQMFRYVGMDKEMMRLMLEVRQLHQQSSDPALRLVDHLARSANNSDFSDRSSMSPAGNQSSPFDADAPADVKNKDAAASESESDLQTTLITFLATLDEENPGSLRCSGAINHRNKARQTLLHIAAAMGYHRLLRRLIVVGAHTDLQDTNGFTALAFAAFCGQVQCARVLIEAGASYDIPTIFGEMPLDLAKAVEHTEVEALLLSAVWSTIPANEPEVPIEPTDSAESGSEIDDDNPSSESDNDGASVSQASKILRLRRPSRRTGKGKQRTPAELPRRDSPVPRRASPAGAAIMPVTGSPSHSEAPPPYTPPGPSWMSRTLSNISHPLSDTLHGLPSLWNSEKDAPHGWVAFPAPSWDTLQKMTSPEEVKLFTQAMAAAAFNAVVQSGATTSHISESAPTRSPTSTKTKKRHQRQGSEDSRSSSQLSTSQVVQQVKQDRMLYLFWLPVLLFVGFWLLVTALPIATGFCLLYARQITRAIKQRL